MEINLAYAAGLIDGEGSICLLKNGGKLGLRTPALSVSMVVPEPINLMKVTLNGFLREHDPPEPNRKRQFRWQIKGNPALEALEKIEPYLVIERRRQIARLLLEEYPRQGPGRSSAPIARAAETEKLFQRMKEINAVRQADVESYSWRSVVAASPTPRQCAYGAAILDGEGWISDKKPLIQVVSTDPELISWMQTTFGGYIYKTPMGAREGWKPTWSWRIGHRNDACLASERLMPFMRIPEKRNRLAMWA